jgi:hypothetical protein
VAFLHQTKVIHSIEDGTYVKPVLEFSKDVYNAIRIWHTRQPLDAPTSSLDLEAQTQRMKGKKFTTSVEKAKQDDKRLPSVDETINPVQRGILRNAKSTKRQNQRKPTNQRQRSGNRIHLHNSTSPNVEGLEKKKWS